MTVRLSRELCEQSIEKSTNQIMESFFRMEQCLELAACRTSKPIVVSTKTRCDSLRPETISKLFDCLSLPTELSVPFSLDLG